VFSRDLSADSVQLYLNNVQLDSDNVQLTVHVFRDPLADIV
jgi:hypothetical protein